MIGLIPPPVYGDYVTFAIVMCALVLLVGGVCVFINVADRDWRLAIEFLLAILVLVALLISVTILKYHAEWTDWHRGHT